MAVATNTRVAKKDATTAYAALNYTDGVRIYKTSNCGATWSLASIQNSITDTVTAVGVIPNTDTVLLSTCSSDTWKIYKSVDGGINFTLTGSRTVYGNGGIGKSAFCVLGSGVIILEIPVRETSNASSFYICRSTDSGNTWGYIGMNTAYAPFNVMSIIEVASGVVLAVETSYINTGSSNVRVARSTDAGLSWYYGPLVSASSLSYISYTQLLNGKVFWVVSSVQTLYYSTNLGATWSSKSIPLNIVRLTSTKNRLIASTTDSKIYISDDEGTTWQQVATTSNPIIDFILF